MGQPGDDALELALSCDLRYATEEAFFAASGVKMGSVESARSLPVAIHHTAAAEMLFTARRVSAVEAAGTGLVTRAVAERLGPMRLGSPKLSGVEYADRPAR